MSEPPANDSKRQVIPEQPTGYVRTVIGIKSTRYVSLPPSIAIALDIKIGDSVYLTQLPDGTISVVPGDAGCLEKSASRPFQSSLMSSLTQTDESPKPHSEAARASIVDVLLLKTSWSTM